VIYKPKRQKFLAVSNAADLSSLLQDALGGGGTWQTFDKLNFMQAKEDL
jgi:hypothetical protein